MPPVEEVQRTALALSAEDRATLARQTALSLPEPDRAALAHAIIDSLENPIDFMDDEEFTTEIVRRAAEVESGQVELIDSQQFIESLRRELQDARKTR